MQNSQLAPTHRPHATGPSLESSRPNSSLLRCPSSQIPAHTSSRVPIQRPQLRNHGIQPLQCWGASTAYGSDSSHSAAAELTRAMAITGGHGMVGTALSHTLLHMPRRHFALAVMAGARANKLQRAMTLRGASGATGLRRPVSLSLWVRVMPWNRGGNCSQSVS